MPEIKPKSKRKSGLSCCCCCFSKKKKSLFTEECRDIKPLRKVHDDNELAYVQDLAEPLKPGSCIITKGVVRSYCKRFAINLVCVKTPEKCDIAFHFNPRLALKYIVRNTRINNSWGQEETTSVEKFKIVRNQTFELQIVATEREFLVALDGRHVCAYVYRLPLEKINRIDVEGIEVESIDIFQQLKAYPSVEGAIDVHSVDLKEVDNYPLSEVKYITYTVPLISDREVNTPTPNDPLVVPITAELPKGFKTDWQLEIIGRVKLLPSAFYINLQEGNKLWPHPMIPLHLNPRFYTSYGNHLFVRNSWQNGEWGDEERTSGFQFTPGKEFHLIIQKKIDKFAVWVDGSLAGEFLFRTPVDNIDTVYIHGDVHIQNIFMKDYCDTKLLSRQKAKSKIKL
ncbi:galectin-9-like isoform X2 [Anthonomus grandis grandis]|uniref:galectin-9-like isoform X2 n=1 Tax=Anthonomus grandis grandis TaxID=2921223 RepID=UPI002165D1FA|nr:galectin-9-like isoform X2 [Anthonomus grandis grandis]